MEQVKRVEARGIIKGCHVVLDAKGAGNDITAFVGVSTSHQCYIDSFATHKVRHETRSTIMESMEP